MKKPQVHTVKYLDWQELRRYLEKKHPKLKLEKLVGLWADYGDFCNGTFVSVERPDPEAPGISEPEIEAFAAVVFDEFPEAVDHYDTIEVKVWW
jgi:hypothetical protein